MANNNNNDETTTITIQLTITGEQGAPRVPLTIDKKISPKELREQASTASNVPLSSLKLIFRGKLISDSANKHAIEEYKLENGSVMHCMGKPVVNKQDVANSNNNAAAGTATATTNLPTVSVVPQAATATTTSAIGVGNDDPLQIALVTMRTRNSPDIYKTAITTLDKLLSNIINHPLEEKYRSIKKSNPAFAKRLGDVQGGHEALIACGFTLTDEMYVLNASPDAWPALLSAKSKVEIAKIQATTTAATAPNNDASTTAGNPFATGAGSGGSGLFPNNDMMGMPPGMGMGMGDPAQMQEMARQMISNPQQLQAMLQNPMVQNMMRNDPRFANNPMLQHAMQEMTNNPQMAQQMSDLMNNNPELLHQQQQQAASMMMNNQFPPPQNSSGAGTAAAGATTTTDPALRMQQMQQMMQMMQQMQQRNNNSSNNNNSTSGGGGGTNNSNNDTDQTEEEMIAEAIRRSLQDNNNGNGGGGSS